MISSRASRAGRGSDAAGSTTAPHTGAQSSTTGQEHCALVPDGGRLDDSDDRKEGSGEWGGEGRGEREAGRGGQEKD